MDEQRDKFRKFFGIWVVKWGFEFGERAVGHLIWDQIAEYFTHE